MQDPRRTNHFHGQLIIQRITCITTEQLHHAQQTVTRHELFVEFPSLNFFTNIPTILKCTLSEK